MEVISPPGAPGPSPTGSVADPFLDAAQIAAQIASHPDGPPRRASFLRLDGGELTSIAEYDVMGETVEGSFKLSDFPDLERAVVSGEVAVRWFRQRAQLRPGAPGMSGEHPLQTSAIVPVHSSAGVVGLIAIDARDDLGFSEAQLQQLTTLATIVGRGIEPAMADRALRDEAERSQALERLKGEFLNIAAHELRSPLGIINGYASMLLEGMLSAEDESTALSRIVDKAAEMERLISEMLETARMEQIGVDLSLAPVDIVEVIDEAVAAMTVMVGVNHRVVMHGGRDPLLTIADRARMVRMLVNLLDNAIKYSPGGGDVEIGWERGIDVVHVSITDHGVGIRPEQLPLLFTRFGRLVTPETSHIRGTGLGLFLAREIARLHGGDIALASEPGQGTTFTVTMPVLPADD